MFLKHCVMVLWRETNVIFSEQVDSVVDVLCLISTVQSVSVAQG